MLTCRDCSKEVSHEAKQCPNCGCKYPTYPSFVSGRLNGIALAFLAIPVGIGFAYLCMVSGEGGPVLPTIGFSVALGGALFFVVRLLGFIWACTLGNWRISAMR